MNQTNSNTILYFGFAAFAVLFIALSYCMRPAIDDYYFIGYLRTYSIPETVSNISMQYSARWSAYTLGAIVLKYATSPILLCLFNTLTAVLFFTGILRLLQVVFAESITRSEKYTYSFLLLITFFFSCFSVAENWFWIIQVCTYIWSIIALLFLLAELFNNRPTVFSYLLLIPCAIFIGGASESYAMVTLMILVLILYLNKKELLSVNKSKTILALLLLLIFVAVMLFMPGTGNRYNALPFAGFFSKLFILFKAYGNLLLLKLPYIIPIIIIGAASFYNLGLKAEHKFSVLNISFFKATVYYFILLFLFIFPGVWIMNELPPARALAQVSLLTLFFVAFLFYKMGSMQLFGKWSIAINFFTSLAVTTFILYNISTKIPLAFSYASKLDTRIELLRKMNNEETTKACNLYPLPASGLLQSAEITPDSLHFANRHFKYGLGLHFNVYCNDINQHK